MERLTEYEIVGGHVHAVPTGDVDQAMMRLAAYEDTGLEPRELSAIVKEWSDLCTIVGECGGIDRLRELAKADKDGRLVVHGRWLHTDWAYHWTSLDKCSVCDYHDEKRQHLGNYSYCPNCGAKMDGGAEDAAD